MMKKVTCSVKRGKLEERATAIRDELRGIFGREMKEVFVLYVVGKVFGCSIWLLSRAFKDSRSARKVRKRK